MPEGQGVNCPHCNKPISHLLVRSEEINFYRYPSHDGSLILEESLTTFCVGESDYFCPECGEIIVETQDDADRFLKGEHSDEHKG